MKIQNINKTKLLIFIFVFIFLFKLFITLSFNNSDWEPDSFMHFIELRTIFADFPNNLSLGLGVWTKPLYAYPLGFLVSLFEGVGVKDILIIQELNILISLVISFFTYKIIYKLFGNFKIALLSIFLTSLSLTLFKSSASALTDQIFGLMLITSAWYALNKNYKLASLLIGLSVLGRIEGLFFVVVYNLWLILEIGAWPNISNKAKIRKILLNWLITIIPVFIWNFLGYLNFGLPLFVIQGGYPSTAGMYGYGGYFSYPRMFLFQEFVVSILLLVGMFFIVRKLREMKTQFFLLLICIQFFGFFLVEAVLWKLGIFGSAGLMRYFVGVIPFMVIIGGYGLYKIFLKTRFNKQLIILGFIILLDLGLLLAHLSGIGFKKQFPESHDDFKIAGEWIKNNISEDEFLYADRPETIYYAGRNLTKSANSFGAEFRAGNPGIYVWSKDWGKDIHHFIPEDFKNENVLFKIEESIYILKVLE